MSRKRKHQEAAASAAASSSVATSTAASAAPAPNPRVTKSDLIHLLLHIKDDYAIFENKMFEVAVKQRIDSLIEQLSRAQALSGEQTEAYLARIGKVFEFINIRIKEEQAARRAAPRLMPIPALPPMPGPMNRPRVPMTRVPASAISLLLPPLNPPLFPPVDRAYATLPPNPMPLRFSSMVNNGASPLAYPLGPSFAFPLPYSPVARTAQLPPSPQTHSAPLRPSPRSLTAAHPLSYLSANAGSSSSSASNPTSSSAVSEAVRTPKKARM